MVATEEVDVTGVFIVVSISSWLPLFRFSSRSIVVRRY